MPELPEVETVRRGLTQKMEGRRLVRVDQRRADLRYPLPEAMADRLTGRVVERIDRRAKYLLLRLDDGMVLVIHLGMSGRMTIAAAAEAARPGPHDHVVFTTEDGWVVTFNDPRRFGMMDMVSSNALGDYPALLRLGPEPLSDAFDAEYLTDRLAGRFMPIKAALLDQTLVAGLGNIYVCEALYHARVSPRRMAASVAGVRAVRLVPAIKQVLTRAIEAGGSSLRDYVQASGELGYFQHAWAVYDREGRACPDCTCDLARTGGIRRVVQSNRSTFYCPTRQR
ncbi:MAG: bifunctional DNA-formamidopyrimidine glycosylase/DNA-(apurinic or apyrimidinic site) lyase [Alphaproteobacteria bacterium]|jgi:formamidopyrimidine-DNA glycosylase|nr:bifunctional DNA-formamidopyrimidine glycosylase/DNA-(apurinic or apyrimidinic site) lyase [Alphaproteobacteria bacterium]